MKTMGPVVVVSDVCPSGGRLSFVDITCVYSYTKFNSSHFASTVYLFLWLTKNNCLNFAVFVNERQMTMYGISVAGITRVFSWHAVLTSHKRIEQDAREAMRVVFSVLTKRICMHKTKFLMNTFKYCFKNYIKLHKFVNCNSANYDVSFVTIMMKIVIP